MRLTNAERALGASLVVYVVVDVLLTPLARLETRNPANVTALGITTLVLIFIGLALSVIALVLLVRRSKRVSMVAIIAAVLYFPAAVAEWTGTFSTLRAPTAIAWLEVVQAVVALVVIGMAYSVGRGATAKP